MIRISKLTDYAMVIMSHLGQHPETVYQASELATLTHIAKPTTAKVLKKLCQHGLILSQRGASGGYKLAKSPDDISIANIVEALEGPLAVVDCTLGIDRCAIAGSCTIHQPWKQINRVIAETLQSFKLTDLIKRATDAHPPNPSSQQRGISHDQFT